MIKHYSSFFDETYYTEVLDNGLRVFIFHKPEFKSTSCAFGTPYGALMINQKFNGKKYSFNPGIAHFLEHKLFEAKGDDMMNQFSAMGANVNAFTSYRETVYFFEKAGEDIEESLNLLLDFVQNLDISEASVEKEKGIIAQEVAMYEQMPDQKLIHEVYRCMYKNNPIKYDIGGDNKSIYAIDKDELELCYKLNYHPANMILAITTPVDPKKIMKVVRNNQANKTFSNVKPPVVCNEKEPDDVVKKRFIFTMPISESKHALAYKQKPFFKNPNDAFKKEWCVRFLFEAHFSDLNPKYQQWLDDGIINDYFGYDIDFDMNTAYIMFYIENDDSKVLKKLVRDSLNENLLTKDLLNQIKRRYIGTMFQVFNDIGNLNTGFIRDSLNGLDFFKEMEDIKSISLKDVENTWKNISFEHEVYVSMNPNKKI